MKCFQLKSIWFEMWSTFYIYRHNHNNELQVFPSDFCHFFRVSLVIRALFTTHTYVHPHHRNRFAMNHVCHTSILELCFIQRLCLQNIYVSRCCCCRWCCIASEWKMCMCTASQSIDLHLISLVVKKSFQYMLHARPPPFNERLSRGVSFRLYHARSIPKINIRFFDVMPAKRECSHPHSWCSSIYVGALFMCLSVLSYRLLYEKTH